MGRRRSFPDPLDEKLCSGRPGVHRSDQRDLKSRCVLQGRSVREQGLTRKARQRPDRLLGSIERGRFVCVTRRWMAEGIDRLNLFMHGC